MRSYPDEYYEGYVIQVTNETDAVLFIDNKLVDTTYAPTPRMMNRFVDDWMGPQWAIGVPHYIDNTARYKLYFLEHQ